MKYLVLIIYKNGPNWEWYDEDNWIFIKKNFVNHSVIKETEVLMYES